MKILANWIRYIRAAGIGLAQTGADSGWTWQNPLPTGNFLRAVVALNSNTLIAVGASGTILRSTDGGATWTRRASGTASDLFGVSFINANVGAAVGAQGTILRTVDAGATWTPRSGNTTRPLRGVSFSGDGAGTAVGAHGDA